MVIINNLKFMVDVLVDHCLLCLIGPYAGFSLNSISLGGTLCFLWIRHWSFLQQTHITVPVTTPKQNTIAAVATFVNTTVEVLRLSITNERICTMLNNTQVHAEIQMYRSECHDLCIHIQLGPDTTGHVCYKQTQLHPCHLDMWFSSSSLLLCH